MTAQEINKQLSFINAYKKAILDCWDWLLLSQKPKLKYVQLSDREKLENQAELIRALTEILEPIVEEIENGTD